jgi:hypothetical protein
MEPCVLEEINQFLFRVTIHVPEIEPIKPVPELLGDPSAVRDTSVGCYAERHVLSQPLGQRLEVVHVLQDTAENGGVYVQVAEIWKRTSIQIAYECPWPTIHEVRRHVDARGIQAFL